MTTKTFTLPFLDRYHDLQALAQFYHRGWHRGAGFLLLYGRHGVGKTRLLHQFLQEQAVDNVFYWQAPPGDAATQLRDFSQALLRYDVDQMVRPSADFSFPDWRAALDYLAQIAESSSVTRLFILEGFTDLCHQAMGLSSYFQHAWDGRLQTIPNLRLILSGSHVSTMIREVLAYSAPLYFRANASLFLKSLPYTALLDLIPHHTSETRLLIYAITGSHPAYLPYFTHTADIVTAIEKLCFAPDSPFLADMGTMFDERVAPLAQNILEAVAGGHHEPAALQQQLANPDEDWQRVLYFLRLMKLIDASPSVHDTLASVRVRYTMADPSLHFYYQHLKPFLGKLPAGEVAAAAYASLRRDLGQTPFVALCREWVWATFITGQLDLMPLRVGAYWPDPQSAAQFDPVAVGVEQKRVLVGEPVWENGHFTTSDLEKIIGNSQQLFRVWPGWTIDLVIFGREPFTADVRADATAAGVRLVTLAEIEPFLLAARERRRWEEANPSLVEIEF
jgi:uncharacterized protein